MRLYHRIKKEFIRICLVSDRDTQTLALVPDIEHAHMIEQLLKSSLRLRQDERIVSFRSIVRPDVDATRHATASAPDVKVWDDSEIV